jgi:hypothetical protein
VPHHVEVETVSSIRVTLTKWTPDGDDPDKNAFDQQPDGMWQKASEPTEFRSG